MEYFFKFIFLLFLILIYVLGRRYFSFKSYNMSSKSIEIAEDLKSEIKKISFQRLKKGKFRLSINDFREYANRFLIKHEGRKEELKSISEYFIYGIKVRHYIARKSDNIILFVHGGAWMQGNLETHDYLCRKFSKIFDMELLAVDYSLAPEKNFPRALDEIFLIYKWCTKRYNKIILAGDSAGGNLVSALCIKLDDIKISKQPCFQILMYPVLSNNFEGESFKKFHYIVHSSKIMAIEALKQYVGKPKENFLDNKYIFPELGNMDVFPKTVLISAECDVLLDSAKKFSKKLGNKAWQIITPGAVHGFMTFGKEFNPEIEEILKKISQSEFFKNI